MKFRSFINSSSEPTSDLISLTFTVQLLSLSPRKIATSVFFRDELANFHHNTGVMVSSLRQV